MGKLLAGQRSISWALLFCCCFVSPFCRVQTDGLQLSTSAAEAGGGAEGSGIPPPIGFANRSPALQRADCGGPVLWGGAGSRLSALRRAGDHAQHGGGMLERYAEQRSQA